ncbi:unnamed protein product [Euphydryas editha]|uniref:Angio-associated migratory cell protein n=1 Tax=Euphydryas editha TaxID=104508 RepID=A0AAU9V2T2_EUPED|nr:unnamed protein product [Euphydryas editha]
MRGQEKDTPPSSTNGDEIGAVDDDVIYFDEMEEVELDDDYDMEELDHLIELERELELGSREDHAQMVFDKHKGSVFCCDMHPNGKLAVSGGIDDKAYVWSIQTGQIVMDCTGHKDSVIFVGFSFDGAFLASFDMRGVIKVWKCNLEDNQQQPWPIIFEYEAGDLSWGFWHFGAWVLICGAVTGDIYVFKIPTGDTKVLQGHNIRTECGKLFRDGVHLAVGYNDGTVKVWDLKSSIIWYQIPASVHQTCVTDIDIHPENKLMASISTDGKFVFTTPSNGKVVAQVQTIHNLELVAFSPDSQLELFALGALNGSLTIWDTARQMSRHNCTEPQDDVAIGVTKMFWIKDQIATGRLDGSVRVYDARSGTQSLMLTGHKGEILDMCYNPKENLILTVAGDGTARVFKYAVKTEND